MPILVRRYEPTDETRWTRCRVLAFLQTAYFDDVLQSKPVYDGESIELVVLEDEEIVGLIDVTVNEATATIETIAVHPDRLRSGIATKMLTAAVEQLPSTVDTVNAWTRDDAVANAWYQSRGFSEAYRYIHVHANGSEIEKAVATTHHGLVAVTGFFHADITAEAVLRDRFRRVHICREYVLHRST